MERLLFLYTPDGAAQIQACLSGIWLDLTPISADRFDWVKVTIPTGSIPLKITISQETTLIDIPETGDFALYLKQLVPVLITTAFKPVLLVTDLDDTLLSIQPGGSEAMQRFFHYWISKRLFTGSKLVYSTGRSYPRYLNVAKEHKGVLIPDLVVTGIGSQAFTVSPKSGLYVPCEDFYRQGDFPGWSSEAVVAALEEKFPFVTKKSGPKEDTELSVLREIQPKDADEHFEAIQAYFNTQFTARTLLSGPSHTLRYLDFIPIGGGKRTSVTYSQHRFGFNWDRTIVAGDSGNDIDMLEGPERCVLPANCQAEVVRWLHSLPAGHRKCLSRCRFADALVEALRRDEEISSGEIDISGIAA
jgi:sucrose-6F-phosphate phosphohydrolase